MGREPRGTRPVCLCVLSDCKLTLAVSCSLDSWNFSCAFLWDLLRWTFSLLAVSTNVTAALHHDTFTFVYCRVIVKVFPYRAVLLSAYNLSHFQKVLFAYQACASSYSSLGLYSIRCVVILPPSGTSPLLYHLHFSSFLRGQYLSRSQTELDKVV